MSGYTDPIGGAPIGVANASYTAFSMSANVTLQWPQYAVAGQPFARLMDVTPTAQDLTLKLPDASLAAAGEATVINNKGSYAVTLLDGGGNTLSVIQPSEVRYCYLMDPSTVAGLWSLVLFGKSNSAQDSSQFAGPGLKAINNTLAWAPRITLLAGTSSLDTTHRAKVVVWTGGSGTVNLPDLASVGDDFVFEFRNQGTGVATLEPFSDQLIDGSANAQFNLNESCLVHASSTGWYTVGRGRSVQFAFSQLVKNIAGGGGTTTLSLSEASSVIQTYTGALTGVATVVLPAVVQVYYVSNQTTGGNNIVFKNPGNGGGSISLAMGQNAVLFSDGTNVINANTTSSGLSTIVLGAGTASGPPISVGGATTGLYAPGSNQLGVAINGVGVVRWDASGTRITAPNAQTELIASSGPATHVIDRISGQFGSLVYRTSGTDRWSWRTTNVAEAGNGTGTDFELVAHNDAGVGAQVMSFNRGSRLAFFTFLPVAAGATMVNTSAAQTLTNKTIDGAQNTIRNINLQSQVVGVLPAANGGLGTGGITSALAPILFIAAVYNYQGANIYDQLSGAGMAHYKAAPGFLFTVDNVQNTLRYAAPVGSDTGVGQQMAGRSTSFLPNGTYMMLGAGFIGRPSLWMKIS